MSRSLPLLYLDVFVGLDIISIIVYGSEVDDIDGRWRMRWWQWKFCLFDGGCQKIPFKNLLMSLPHSLLKSRDVQ